ncbi:MAG TPA: nucleotidyltransferase family protein [Phycisphaerae bacterium]|nr:nucleotidyltransferase family protein [Phycisphaerae bacterium]
MNPSVRIDRGKIAEFCRKWKVTQLALFGSVLRDDFGPDSDVDVLVSFADEARPGLFELCRMEDELRALFGRDVDLVTRKSVEQSRNYIRRKHILKHMETIHAAG